MARGQTTAAAMALTVRRAVRREWCVRGCVRLLAPLKPLLKAPEADTAPAAAGTFGGCGRALAGAAGDSANGDVCGDGMRTFSALAQVLPTDSDDEQPTDTEEVCGSRCSRDAEEASEQRRRWWRCSRERRLGWRRDAKR